MNKISVYELIYAYTQGYFPMAEPDENNAIYWHKPKKRAIIPLDKFHISKNLKKLYAKGKFRCTINSDFEGVIRACANRNETWISEEIIELYCKVHKMGYALSVETYLNNKLVGGLYGISIGKAFFGESMFHKETDASKIALVYLVEQLKKNKYILLDTQYINNHTKRFGAIEIEDSDFDVLLKKALETN